jgi:hypothetical protein
MVDLWDGSMVLRLDDLMVVALVSWKVEQLDVDSVEKMVDKLVHRLVTKLVV